MSDSARFAHEWRSPVSAIRFHRRKFLVYEPGRATTEAWTPLVVLRFTLLLPFTVVIGIFRALLEEFGVKFTNEVPIGAIRSSALQKKSPALAAVDALKFASRSFDIIFSRSRVAFVASSGDRKIIWQSPPDLETQVRAESESRLLVEWPGLATLSFYLNPEQYREAANFLGI